MPEIQQKEDTMLIPSLDAQDESAGVILEQTASLPPISPAYDPPPEPLEYSTIDKCGVLNVPDPGAAAVHHPLEQEDWLEDIENAYDEQCSELKESLMDESDSDQDQEWEDSEDRELEPSEVAKIIQDWQDETFAVEQQLRGKSYNCRQ